MVEGIGLSFGVVIILILSLFAALLLIFWGKQGILDLGTWTLEKISLQDRCQGKVPAEFERFIKGYHDKESFTEVYNLCKAYRNCFLPKYNQFVKKNKEVCKLLTS